jgi:hypothetical protein
MHRLQTRTTGPSLAEAIAAFCDTLEARGTRRVYAGTLHGLLAELGPETPVASLTEPATGAAISAWFTERWGGRAPRIVMSLPTSKSRPRTPTSAPSTSSMLRAASLHPLQVDTGAGGRLGGLALDLLQQGLRQLQQLGIALGARLSQFLGEGGLLGRGVGPSFQGLNVRLDLREPGGESRLEPPVGVLDRLGGDLGQAGGGAGGKGGGDGFHACGSSSSRRVSRSIARDRRGCQRLTGLPFRNPFPEPWRPGKFGCQCTAGRSDGL